jgi:hypothetical protein
MIATPTDLDVTAVVARLEQEVRDLGDPHTLTSYRAQEEHAAQESALKGRLRTIRIAVKTITELDPQIEALSTWRDYLITWRAQFVDQLKTATPRQINGLQLSIRRIDVGLDLMRELFPARLPLDDRMAECGYTPQDAAARACGDAWIGTLSYTEARLKDLCAQRDEERDRLARALIG